MFSFPSRFFRNLELVVFLQSYSIIDMSYCSVHEVMIGLNISPIVNNSNNDNDDDDDDDDDEDDDDSIITDCQI